MNLGDIIRLNAMKLPNKTALVFRNTRLSYSELNERVNRVANGLLGIGVEKGDRVAVLADNCSEYVETYFATAKGGMLIVPINTTLDIDGLAYILNNSGANTLIFGQEYSDIVNTLRAKLEITRHYIVIGKVARADSYEELFSGYPPDEPEIVVDEDDIAWLLYTSGTTGPPKGVMLSHKSQIVDSANTLLTCFPITRNDIHLVILPLFHIGALWHMRCHFYMGNTTVLMDARDPRLVLEIIQREKVTTMCFVPPMIVPIVNYPNINEYDVSSMRIMIYSGAPLAEGLERRLHHIFGDIIIQVYALTEGGPGIIMPPLMEGPWEKVKRAGSCGKDVLNVEVRLVNEAGKDCAPGEVGEILARGDNIMKGYWDMPEVTAKTLEGGYLHTGDLATRDEEGYYYITGRKKDVITSSGKPVYSPEIENVISLHPSVSEVAVIGVPDKELGETVKAVVVPQRGAKVAEKEIISWCASRLDDYKVPKSVYIVDSLPKTPSGKVLRTVLRERYTK
jgi:acyl-CoA synthetase (AMP-forming)/AMP-acid ligase II